MLINPTGQRLSEPLPSNLSGLPPQENQPPPSVTTDLLQVSSPRGTVDGIDATVELDAAGALTALDFARRSIDLNPEGAISVQANARPENVLGLIGEANLT